MTCRPRRQSRTGHGVTSYERAPTSSGWLFPVMSAKATPETNAEHQLAGLLDAPPTRFPTTPLTSIRDSIGSAAQRPANGDVASSDVPIWCRWWEGRWCARFGDRRYRKSKCLLPASSEIGYSTRPPGAAKNRSRRPDAWEAPVDPIDRLRFHLPRS
jgi:hypothetical protein